MSASSKNRGKKSRSSKQAGKRVSGNPATRAAEEHRRQLSALYGGTTAEITAWWPASAEDVLAKASDLQHAEGMMALEGAAGRLLGNELALRIEQNRVGLNFPQWLATVADHAAEHIHEVHDAGGDPGPSWLLLQAIAAIGTDHAAQVARGHINKLQPTVAAELTARYPWTAQAAAPARPGGPLLAAVDGYGSRYLLVAPFETSEEDATPQWYAWDIDLCDVQRTVAAAAFNDPSDALAEWKTAVGADTTASSELTPLTDPATVRDLLRDCLFPDTFGGSVMGDEPIELLSEYFRMRSRAVSLSKSLPGHSPSPRISAQRRADTLTDSQRALAKFTAWCQDRQDRQEQEEREGDAVGFDDEAVSTLIFEWVDIGPRIAKFSCSPHRIRGMAEFFHDSYEPEQAANVFALFPTWVAWCAEQTGLAPALTERALAEARRSPTAAALTHDHEANHGGNPRIVE